MTQHKLISIQTEAGAMDVYLFPSPSASDNTPAPLVIMNTDIWGVRPVFMDYARALSAAGYCVAVPNLYYRVAAPPVIDFSWSFADQRAQQRFTELLGGISIAGLLSDHACILEQLPSHTAVDTARVGIVGYCMSGAIALRVAAAFPDRVLAALAFHGGHLVTDSPESPHRIVSAIKGRVFLGHASDDIWMTRDQIHQLDQALDLAKVSYRSITLPGRHGYAVIGSPNYHAPSARQHWAEIHGLLASSVSVLENVPS